LLPTLIDMTIALLVRCDARSESDRRVAMTSGIFFIRFGARRRERRAIGSSMVGLRPLFARLLRGRSRCRYSGPDGARQFHRNDKSMSTPTGSHPCEIPAFAWRKPTPDLYGPCPCLRLPGHSHAFATSAPWQAVLSSIFTSST
jgi:hypothetical protein